VSNFEHLAAFGLCDFAHRITAPSRAFLLAVRGEGLKILSTGFLRRRRRAGDEGGCDRDEENSTHDD
jgi:hypothetical protein